MALSTSSKEPEQEKPQSSFLKGTIAGAVCVGLLSAVGFTYLSQEKRLSEEETIASFSPIEVNNYVLDDEPVFSSVEWLSFSKAYAAKNQKELEGSTNEDLEAIWWPTMNDRKLVIKRSQDDSYLRFFDRFAMENAKTLAIKNCMGTPSEDIDHLRMLYSENMVEGRIAMDKAMKELSFTICKK